MVVVAVAVAAYLVGASREKLVILDGPRATTGVLWHCGDRLTGVIAVPARHVTLEAGERRIPATPQEEGLVALHVGPAPLPYRVWVVSGSQRLSVPVLSCTAPSTEP